MKPHFKLCILLTYALRCMATIVPRRTQSNDITPYLHSLGIPLTARQDTSCLSEEECGDGMLCIQLVGEPFCKTDCSGFCLPEDLRDRICNCELPCKEGICTDPFPGAEKADNGLCSPEKDRETLQCPGQEEDENVSGGSAEGDKEDMTDKPDSADEKEGDDGNDEARGGDEEEPRQEDKEKEDGEQELEKMEEEKDPGSKPDQTESDDLAPSPNTPDATAPSPETSEAPVLSPDTSGATTPSSETEQSESDNAEEQSTSVCISTEHLAHLPSSSLVFRNDVLAPVLCDTSGSCATAGHMVVFRGRGMMMRRYCEEVGCVKRVMWVNSPLYKTGVRLESRSSNMSFTALAARFETVAEEAVLAAAVRVGL